VATRSEVKRIVRAGRVRVDGEAVTAPETKLDPAAAAVTLDGERLVWARHHYYMMNKPAGVLTATEDRRQKTVLDLLPGELRRMGLFPVGRLDRDTRGLLLLTDDGDFAHRVISPKFAVEKMYDASVEGRPDESDVAAFAAGLVLGDGTKCRPARLELLGEGRCLVTVTEGKYHQVKRMLAARGKPVTALKRLSIGALRLPDELAEGAVVPLAEEDLCRVFMVR
jgi:16S rRNA pseudouridine516 synthase